MFNNFFKLVSLLSEVTPLSVISLTNCEDEIPFVCLGNQLTIPFF